MLLNEVAAYIHLSHNAREAQRRRSRVCSPGVLYNKEVVLFNAICTRQYDVQYDVSLLIRQSFDIPR